MDRFWNGTEYHLLGYSILRGTGIGYLSTDRSVMDAG